MSLAPAIERALKTVEARCDASTSRAQQFLWRGVWIPCIPSNGLDSYALKAGGFEGNPGLRLLVRWAIWKLSDTTLITTDSGDVTMDSAAGSATAGDQVIGTEDGGNLQNQSGGNLEYTDDQNQLRQPVAGKRLTFRGKQYRIDSAKMNMQGAYIVLELGDVNR